MMKFRVIPFAYALRIHESHNHCAQCNALTDHGKQRHCSDLDAVLARAWKHDVAAIMVTAGTLEEAVAARALCRRDARLFGMFCHCALVVCCLCCCL